MNYHDHQLPKPDTPFTASSSSCSPSPISASSRVPPIVFLLFQALRSDCPMDSANTMTEAFGPVASNGDMTIGGNVQPQDLASCGDQIAKLLRPLRLTLMSKL